MKHKPPPTYDSEVLGLLAYEFPASDREDTNDNIRKRLRRKKLGEYDPARIQLLRGFKEQVRREIHQQEKSGYYQGAADSKVRLQKYAEMGDFDIPRLTADMIAAYPGIPGAEIERFVPFAVFIYHLL